MKKLALLTAVLLLGMRTPARADNPPATKLTNKPILLKGSVSHFSSANGYIGDQTENNEYLSGCEDLEEGDYERAESNFRKALAILPTSLQDLEHLAYALVGLNKPAQALRLLHSAYYQNGHNLYTSGMDLRAYMTYALLEIEAGSWNEAALAYDLAGNTGFKYKSFGDVPEVNVLFRPDIPQPILLIAAANIVLGELSMDRTQDYPGNGLFDHAISHLKIAVNLEPAWAAAWFYYGDVLQSAKRYIQASDAFNKAISLDGNDKKFTSQTLLHGGVSFVMAYRERKAAAKSKLKK